MFILAIHKYIISENYSLLIFPATRDTFTLYAEYILERYNLKCLSFVLQPETDI